MIAAFDFLNRDLKLRILSVIKQIVETLFAAVLIFSRSNFPARRMKRQPDLEPVTEIRFVFHWNRRIKLLTALPAGGRVKMTTPPTAA